MLRSCLIYFYFNIEKIASFGYVAFKRGFLHCVIFIFEPSRECFAHLPHLSVHYHIQNDVQITLILNISFVIVTTFLDMVWKLPVDFTKSLCQEIPDLENSVVALSWGIWGAKATNWLLVIISFSWLFLENRLPEYIYFQ